MVDVRVMAWKAARDSCGVRPPESAVRSVLVVFSGSTGDGLLCVEALVVADTDLIFFQTVMEAFDVAVAFGVVVGGAAMLMPSRLRVSS